MEHLLHLYEQPYDPLRPLIAFDERPCQLIGDVITPLAMEPAKPKRQDHQYQRKGTCCVFLAFDPHLGRRFIQVRKQRTKKDYATFMKRLVETYYPHVEQIVLVQDNLNTHNPGSFYELLSPAHAFALSERFDMHYTPSNASWLNMAELELAALTKQCLDRRIPDIDTLTREINAWQRDRDQRKISINWQFSKTKARQKLQRHYPTNN
jgi:hypothetical protein